MRFKKELKKHREPPRVDLTPMIDVVFQLLIFFMLSATFVVQSSIEIEMPEAEGTTELEQKDLSITLTYADNGAGEIYLDNQRVANMDELGQVLRLKVEENPNVFVLVRGDKRTDIGRLVEVLGIGESVGVSNWGIASQPPAANR